MTERHTEVLEGVSGMNVISPTWFFLSDNDGNFASIGSSSYVQEAHDRGLEVWALVDNFSYDVDTKAILSYTSKRQKLIEGLINEALSLGVDGINVDFEQVPGDAGEDYIEFLRELSIPCRANGLEDRAEIDRVIADARRSENDLRRVKRCIHARKRMMEARRRKEADNG